MGMISTSLSSGGILQVKGNS